jgi:multidrug efflux pump
MVLVTGMTVGTIFTLFVVPVFYSMIAAQHQRDPLSTALPGAAERTLGMAGAES